MQACWLTQIQVSRDRAVYNFRGINSLLYTVQYLSFYPPRVIPIALHPTMWPFTSASQPSPAAPTPAADKCPVDHSTRAAWLQANQSASPFHPSDKREAAPTPAPAPVETFIQTATNTAQDSAAPSPPAQTTTSRDESYLAAFLARLSNKREVSSIPRYASGSTPPAVSPNGEQTVTSSVPVPPSDAHSSSAASDPPDETHWVYPSEQQFFLAMMRKHAAKMYTPDMPAPKPEDMKTIVPIHNAVNERAWGEVMKWERGQGGEACGGVRLVSFKGRPRDRTPKAWLNVALGSVPFPPFHSLLVRSLTGATTVTLRRLTDTTGSLTAAAKRYAT